MGIRIRTYKPSVCQPLFDIESKSIQNLVPFQNKKDKSKSNQVMLTLAHIEHWVWLVSYSSLENTRNYQLVIDQFHAHSMMMTMNNLFRFRLVLEYENYTLIFNNKKKKKQFQWEFFFAMKGITLIIDVHWWRWCWMIWIWWIGTCRMSWWNTWWTIRRI